MTPHPDSMHPDRPGAFTGLGPVLDSPIKVAAVYVGSLLVLSIGLATVGSAYSDVQFASDYLWAELIVALAFGAIALLLSHRGQIGIRQPSIGLSGAVAGPLAVIAVMAVGAVWSWNGLPAGVSTDYGLLGRTFLTLGLVGFTEEWMYRGVLLVLLTRLLGFRRGVILAALMFGALHLLNVLGGQSMTAVAGQFAATTILGFMFIRLVLDTRSLWVAVIVHGLYDFFLISDSVFKDAGSDGSPMVPIGSALAVVVGIVALVSLMRNPRGEFYESVAGIEGSSRR